MPIILNFDSLDSANTYWLESFNRIPNSIIIDPQQIRNQYAMGIHAINYANVNFSSKFVSSFNSVDDPHCYAFISKSNYRKIVHSDLPESLFKRFYNSLKDKGYIVDASTVHVILLTKPLTQELYDSFQNTYSTDIKSTLESLLDRIEFAEKDSQYYLKYIENLEQKCKTLENDIDQARQDLVNRNMTTWY